MPIDYTKVPSPCYVLDEEKLVENLSLVQRIQDEAGVRIILAFKAFAMWSVFPLIRKYIQGAATSSLNEVRLCSEELKIKSHTYAVAYQEKDFDEILDLSSHITFNSISQFERHKKKAVGKVNCGLRVNPEWSDVKTELYNPASSQSRLGVTSACMPEKLPAEIDGLHFHVLCESDSYSLEKVLHNLEGKFQGYLNQVSWVNMGGGHLFTQKNYDVDHLISILKNFKERHNVEVILEPGCAFVWQAGDLVSTALDIVENGGVKTAILDVSFAAHMPDTLEMPYRPDVVGASCEVTKKSYPYRLGGVSCLAGDYLEEYYFDALLSVGDKVVLKDMMDYTMVKTTMFNGVDHPCIAIWREGKLEIIREFDYQDFKGRLS